ncbi:MAG TPA: hypothetical protein VMF66_20610, partial [Candidatus Acidoferrum sp.]|nr:hypothetical protein [Candidatus Acidoferrum sp.]
AAAAKKTAETFERKRDLLRQRGETLRFEFVASELDLAITFCESAASTSDPEKSKRSVLRAKEAYETAKHFLSGEQISEPMRRTIQEKISRLELLLNKAG